VPKQNRVDPFGVLHATPERGLFFGNRGGSFMRADGTLKARHWASQQWIICALKFKNLKHEIDNPKTYTGLFFLDEATALAAGHRPCFYCRRAEAEAFKAALIASGAIAAGAKVKDMDAMIAGDVQRILSGAAPRERIVPAALPDGAMYDAGDAAYLKHGAAAHAWSFAGYGAPRALHASGLRLTPAASCAALSAGYTPALHSSVHGA
jgi:hypothetical protein